MVSGRVAAVSDGRQHLRQALANLKETAGRHEDLVLNGFNSTIPLTLEIRVYSTLSCIWVFGTVRWNKTITELLLLVKNLQKSKIQFKN